MNRFLLPKWAKILLLLLPLYSGYLQAANTLIVGSKTTSDGSGINKNRGPAGDGYSTTTFTTGNSQIVIGRATTLQYSNIKIQLQADTAGNGNTGVIYCALGDGRPHFTGKSFCRKPLRL